jgi:hypothetical protein
LVLSGRTSDNIIGESVESKLVDWKNIGMIKKYLISRSFGIAIFSLGLILLAISFLRERERNRKDFLMLNCLWIFITFAILIPFVFELSPRFFLLFAPIPFICLGLILKFANRLAGKNNWVLSAAIIISLLFSNADLLKERADGYQKAASERVEFKNYSILKESIPVTYFQENLIADYMQNFYAKNGFPVLFGGEPEYDPAFEYILKARGVPNGSISKKSIYQKANYFYVVKSSPYAEWDYGEYMEKYDVKDMKEFGTLAVLTLEPKPGTVTGTEKDFASVAEEESRSKSPRYKWNQIFSGIGTGNDDEN